MSTADAVDPGNPSRPGGRDRRVGLCLRCLHGRRVRSDRGAIFWLCRRSRTDDRFPRYPRLPVIRCVGFEEGGAGRAGEGDPDDGSPAPRRDGPPAGDEA